MHAESVRPFSRDGGWIGADWSRYYRAALNKLDGLSQLEGALSDELRASEYEWTAGGGAGEDAKGYAYHKTRDMRERLDLETIWVEILCCMAVEAFLNFYGVVCVGEQFFKRNWERLGITEKLVTLLATTRGTLLPDDSELVKTTRKMFDRRNALVHPKSKEFSPSTEFSERSSLREAANTVEQLRSFFLAFPEHDPEARTWVRLGTQPRGVPSELP